MQELNITDRMVYLAMRALGNDIKGKHLSEICKHENLYVPTATDEEIFAYSGLWEHMVSVIETRWFYSTKEHRLMPHKGKGLVVTPLGLINQILGKSPTPQERHDLVCRTSERLMISSFAAFKRRHGDDESSNGLAQQYLRFMYTALCFELSNQMKHKINADVRSYREEDVDAPRSKDDMRPKFEPYVDMYMHKYSKLVIVDMQDDEMPIAFCIDRDTVAQFREDCEACLSDTQKKIMDLTFLYNFGELGLDVGVKLSDYITSELKMSHDAYYVQRNRIRSTLVAYYRNKTNDV